MKWTNLIRLIATSGLILMTGCASHPSRTAQRAEEEQLAGRPAAGQPTFSSDDAVAHALVAAVKADDHAKVHELLGPDWRELVSGDKVEDENAYKEFARRAGEKMRLEKHSDTESILHVGDDDWSLPIPIMKDSDGKWFLDTGAGKQEVLARRIGRNELQAIKVCHLYVDAQRQYFDQHHEYAEHISSRQGKRDGLYWESDNGQSSAFAKLVFDAKIEGYSTPPGRHAPFFGYRFRTLKSQGPDAARGKMDYVANGKMSGGFALVAYPVAYEASGIMTFIVNKDGAVFQKDLGPHTVEIARKMTAYDPDTTWKTAKE